MGKVYPYVYLLLAVAVGLVPYIAVSLSPFSFLLANIIPDDAFYYFQIARNITEGLGSTFDGVNITNGYHPLWMLLLLPVWELFSVGGAYDVAPIRVALFVQLFLAFVTVGVLIRIMSRYTKSQLVLAVSVLLWLVNPFVVYESMSGLETGLVLVFLSSFFLAALRMQEAPSYKQAVFIGIFAGLLMLARLDMVFYFVMFLLWLLYIYGRMGIRYSFVSGAIATIVVAPFLLWNMSTFNMLFTSASVASTTVNKHLIEQDNGVSLFVSAKAVVYTVVRGTSDVLVQTGAPVAFLIFLGCVGGWVWFGRKGYFKLFISVIPLEWFLFGGFILHFFVSTAVRFTYRNWYFIAFNLFAVLLVTWALAQWHRERVIRVGVVVGALAVVFGMYLITWQQVLFERERSQQNMFQAAMWMNEHLPPGAVIGVFNAGVQGYFSEHRVVNLDGLVNNAASQALQNRVLWEYALHTENITHISDYPLYISYRYSEFLGTETPFLDLRKVHSVSETGAHSRGDALEIYEVVSVE